MEKAALVLLTIGVFFNLLGTVALYRFPDVYTRLHGTTKCTTFGSIFTSAAVVIYALQIKLRTGDSRFTTLSVHVVLAIAALLMSNPTGAHAIARAAYRSGVLPKYAVVDRLAEENRKRGGESA